MPCLAPLLFLDNLADCDDKGDRNDHFKRAHNFLLGETYLVNDGCGVSAGFRFLRPAACCC